eukprot:764898-Hanusia_phi.AAC.7
MGGGKRDLGADARDTDGGRDSVQGRMSCNESEEHGDGAATSLTLMLCCHPEGVEDDDGHDEDVVRLGLEDQVELLPQRLLGNLWLELLLEPIHGNERRSPDALLLGEERGSSLPPDVVDENTDDKLADEDVGNEDVEAIRGDVSPQCCPTRKKGVEDRNRRAEERRGEASRRDERRDKRRSLTEERGCSPGLTAILSILTAAAADDLEVARHVHEAVEDRSQIVLRRQAKESDACSRKVVKVLRRRRPNAGHEDRLADETTDALLAGELHETAAGDVRNAPEVEADAVAGVRDCLVVAGVEAAAKQRDAHEPEDEHEEEEEVDDVEDGADAGDESGHQPLHCLAPLLQRSDDADDSDALEASDAEAEGQDIEDHHDDDARVEQVPSSLLGAGEEGGLALRVLDALRGDAGGGEEAVSEDLETRLHGEEAQEADVDREAICLREDRVVVGVDLHEDNGEDDGEEDEEVKLLILHEAVGELARRLKV